MSLTARLASGALLILLCSGGTLAQQSAPPAPGTILLDVVVRPKSGAPVAGLEQQDFSILDNKVAQPMTSFRALRGRQAPVEVILVLDDVNTGLSNVAYEPSSYNSVESKKNRFTQTSSRSPPCCAKRKSRCIASTRSRPSSRRGTTTGRIS